MTITGTLTDSSNNKPIPGAEFSVYYSGNMAGPANATFQSDASGNYSYTDASLDTAPAPILSVQAPGYSQGVGNPEYWAGVNTLDPLATSTSTVPGWVWIAVAAAVIFGFVFINKKYKLL